MNRSVDPALHQLQQRLELILVSSGFGVWEMDIETGKMTWDQQMYDIYGVNPETFEPTRENWRSRVHPAEQEIGTSRFDKVLKGFTVGLFETRIIRASDNSIRYLESTGVLQKDPSGKPTVLLGLNRDITVRKNAELHKATVTKTMTRIAEKAPLSEILEAIVEDVETTRLDMFCSVLLLNGSGERFLFGAGRGVKKFYDACIAGVPIGPEVGACGASAALKKRVVTRDIQTDPNWIPFRGLAAAAGFSSCWSEPILLGTKVLGTFAMYHRSVQTPNEEDTQMIEACARLAAVAIQHSQTEQELERQQTKLMSSVKMAALGEMASGIAHEVNNPLTIIVGKAWQLKKQSEEEKFDRAVFSAELGRIVETSNRIAKVIKGLQSFSRNADLDPFDRLPISQIVEDALELSKERFRNHRVAIKLDMVNRGILVAARPAQLTQVLLNLLNNAFDAVVTRAEAWVELSVVTREKKIVVSVTDCGFGLSDLVADKVMQPFFTTKDVGKGTGLGLSISKGIVEDHGGRLYYDRASRHTRFVIELPRSDETR